MHFAKIDTIVQNIKHFAIKLQNPGFVNEIVNEIGDRIDKRNLVKGEIRKDNPQKSGKKCRGPSADVSAASAPAPRQDYELSRPCRNVEENN